MATDAELNAFLGVKQYAAFRPDGGAGAGRVGRDKRLWELKKKLKGRQWGEEPEEAGGKRKWNKNEGTGANGEKIEKKKRVGKKERSRQAAAKAASASGEGQADAAGGGEQEGSAKKKRKVE